MSFAVAFRREPSAVLDLVEVLVEVGDCALDGALPLALEVWPPAAVFDEGDLSADSDRLRRLVLPTGGVKVTDFGIARAVADTSATMAQTAAVIGTAPYLSPEQARGETVDERSDLYSTGCLLYELLVGRPPIVGSIRSVLEQHLEDSPIPPSSFYPDGDAVSSAYNFVVQKALEKRREDRYASAREMNQIFRSSFRGKQ